MNLKNKEKWRKERMEKKCKRCRRLIIKDWVKWLRENKHQHYLQCPYCFQMEKLKW